MAIGARKESVMNYWRRHYQRKQRRCQYISSVTARAKIQQQILNKLVINGRMTKTDVTCLYQGLTPH